MIADLRGPNNSGQSFRNNMPRKPRVHAGADEYFKRRPEAGMPMRQAGLRTSKPNNRRSLGGNSWLVYVYWLLGGLATVALIYLIGSFLRSAGVSASLVFQEGEVQVKRGGNGEWETVDTDAKLKNMDEIKTLAGAKAIINFEDGSMLRMGEYTRIILTGKKNKLTVIQTDGETYHRVLKDEERTYEVDMTGVEGMPEMKIESLGTAFWVKKMGTEVTAGVLESQVKFIKEEEEIELDEGQKITVREGSEERKDIETNDLTSDFISWNIDQDRKKELSISSYVRLKLANAEEEQAKEEVSNTGEDEVGSGGEMGEGIVLSGEASNSGVALSWTLNGLEAPEGFKVMRGTESNPEYPGSYYRSVRSPSATSYTWDVADGKTHHFRICIYDGSSGCEVYSNDLEVETVKRDESQTELDCKNSGGTWSDENDKCSCPSGEKLSQGKCVSEDEEEKKDDCENSGGTWSNSKCSCPSGETLEGGRCIKVDYATSISLKASNDDKKTANLSWSISGGDAPDGYRIVRSKKKSPTYPDDDSKSISKESITSYDWEDLTKGETYYFRVCVWNGEECEVYSENEKLEIEK